MRVLLLQAVSNFPYGEAVYPLGLARLAGVLAGSHQLAGLDLNLPPDPWSQIKALLTDFKPQAVCVSFRNLDPLAGNHVSWLPHLQALASLIKRQAPEAKLIAGGSGFSLFARRLMQEVPEIDLGVVGEAEHALPRILEGLPQGRVPAGVIQREGAGTVGGQFLHCPDFAELPPPSYAVFAPSDYLERNRYVAFMGLESKRGCPHHCSYCLYPLLQGCRVRLRPPKLVVGQMQTLAEQYGLEMVHFTDAVLNQPAAHLRAICEEMLNRGLRMQWTGFFREDAISAQDLELYQKAGLMTIYFSADGASEQALSLLDKGISLEQVKSASRAAAASGLITVYHFLVNLPGENQTTVDQTKGLLEEIINNHARLNNPAAMVFNNLRMYPGAALTRMIFAQGLADPEQDLLYPAYYNPPPWDGLRYELNAMCLQHEAATSSKSVQGDN